MRNHRILFAGPRCILGAAALLLLLATPGRCQTETVATSGLHGRLDDAGGRRELVLWGAPRERGFAHGYLLAETIVRDFSDDLRKFMAAALPLYGSQVLKKIVPNFAFSEDETQELEGILAGLEARLPEPQRKIAALGRSITLDDLKAMNTVGDWIALACSTFVVDGTMTADGKTAAARNFDFGGMKLVLEDQLVIVVRPESGHGYGGIGYPGGVGVLTGMNDEGVFVSIHDVRVRATFELARRGKSQGSAPCAGS